MRRPSQAHFVTACQQVLALGAVLAVLTPAASIISLDVVREVPAQDGASAARQVIGLSAYTREARRPSRLPAAPTDATIHDFALTSPTGSFGRAAVAGGAHRVVSQPEKVVGYGGVGVTWDPSAQLTDRQITFRVRALTDGTWSAWQDLGYDVEHGPDPGSADAAQARPGTDVVFVGNVDRVQVKATTPDAVALPPAMKLSVVSPGTPRATTQAGPAIDTARMAGATSTPGEDALATSPRAASMLAQETYTPKPVIYSRAQWGADESMRDKSSLHYGEVHAGFVHHTVNANDYTRAEVPGIMRSIYAYHTQSRGWSDIGYNFLVDRFGRIWEGRYGGVDRPVVGAHTLNYNDWSFAMSAIGNYDITQPRDVVLRAYGSLFAWKLSLHGVDAASTKQWVGSRDFEAINGHRDAASTACPGRYLYAKIPLIRQYAEQDQQGWAGRELHSDLAGSLHPDIVARRASDGRGFIIPTGGLSAFGKPVVTRDLYTGAASVVASPDLTGDGTGDLVVVGTDGSAAVRPGDGQGGYAAAVKPTALFSGRDQVTAVGDLDGDGHNDLVSRNIATGELNTYLGSGTGGFARQRLVGDWSGATLLVSAGDLDGDGHVDLLSRDSGGSLWLHPGTGTGSFGTATKVPGSFGQWTQMTGAGDYSGDGRPDLVVRAAESAYVLPSTATGGYGHPLGPFARLGVAGLSAGSQLAGGPALDVVGRKGVDLYTWPNAGTVDLEPAIPTNLRLGSADAILTVGDWDRDGYGDVVVRKTTTGNLVLRRGDGTGHFAAGIALGTGFGGVRLLAAVGDMTGDGFPDLMGQPQGGSMRIYPGNGLTGLQPSYVAHSAITAGTQIPVGRWDGDGAPDSLFRKGGSLTLYPGNGPGGLTSARSMSVDLSRYDWVVGVSNLRLSGHPDLVVRDSRTGYLWALQATANGFRAPRFLGEGMGVYDLAG